MTWFRNAIIYGIDVDVFFDASGDGIGDFEGLLAKLPYLVDLGVTCLWILPFYPTPNRDNGYDIRDYYEIDPRLGDLETFSRFVREAKRHGLRVITDLVMNHTSDEHPWFQASRRSARSRYRDYYVWTQDPPPTPPDKGTIFPGEESSIWTFDEMAGAYYHHRFYHFEPSLRLENPEVQDEVQKVIDYWLCFGVDGMRIDAASHMIEGRILNDTTLPLPHELLRKLRRWAEEQQREVVLLGEADEDATKLSQYFGKGDELNMLFNFLLNNFFFLALATKSAEPLQRVLELTPPLPAGCAWANFVRNLDELDLERLSDEERETVYKAFAPDPGMRIFDRGIRRRVAPMLKGNRRRLELAWSLMFSLPGAPMFVYGDEIGMGENLEWEGRIAVRGPMQWTGGKNGGFSTAAASKLTRKPIASGDFGYRNTNVEKQRNDPGSFLNWFRELIRTRRSCSQIGDGELQVVRYENPAVFAHRIRHEGGSLLFLHNMSDRRVEVDVKGLSRADHDLHPIFPEPDDEPLPESFELGSYGYVWLISENGS